MKKRSKIKCKMGLILLAVAALLLVIAPTQAMAKDTDGDGFTDLEEESLFLLPGQLVSVDGNTSLDLNPEVKDLVVILIPAASGSNLVTILEPFKYVRDFGINVHVVQCTNNETCSRDLETELGQKAIRAQESVKGSSTLGKCDEEWCTPNSGLDNIWVWTQAIKNHIASTCGNKKTCKDNSTGFTGVDLENLYIQHTFAHEIGHDMKLRKDNVQKTGGWHYAAREDKTLSQYVKTRTGKTSVTWYIGTEFARDDFKDVLLWELH